MSAYERQSERSAEIVGKTNLTQPDIGRIEISLCSSLCCLIEV
jgi:hypothetical protein